MQTHLRTTVEQEDSGEIEGEDEVSQLRIKQHLKLVKLIKI